MPITLYQMPYSSPVQAVLVTAAKLNVKLDQKFVDLASGEHLKPEFLAINPAHTVPTIDDDGFILWESRAIITYLVNKYGPGNSLYPEDPKIRAAVDRMLYFDIGTLYKSVLGVIEPIFHGNKWPDSDKEEAVRKALTIFEELLGKTSYAACDHSTLADYSLLPCIDLLVEGGIYSLKPYPRINAWYEKVKAEIPNFQKICTEPNHLFKKWTDAAKLHKGN